MKYEMIFGDQSLFDGAPDGAEMVGGLSYKCRLFYKFVGGDLYASLGTYDNFTKEQITTPKDIKVSAMRRIIAEPKRWTVEDQKAGRLPEVGSEVSFCHIINTTFRQGVVKYIDSKIIVIETSNEIRPFVYEVDRVELKPIETPEEKAQREEDAFVDSESFFIDVCTMSGPMKAAYKQGARAAYRKLKGGE